MKPRNILMIIASMLFCNILSAKPVTFPTKSGGTLTLYPESISKDEKGSAIAVKLGEKNSPKYWVASFLYYKKDCINGRGYVTVEDKDNINIFEWDTKKHPDDVRANIAMYVCYKSFGIELMTPAPIAKHDKSTIRIPGIPRYYSQGEIRENTEAHARALKKLKEDQETD